MRDGSHTANVPKNPNEPSVRIAKSKPVNVTIQNRRLVWEQDVGDKCPFVGIERDRRRA